VERAVGYTEKLELTKEERESLKKWRGGLSGPATALAATDAVIRDEPNTRHAGYMLYTLCGPSLYRGFTLGGGENADADAVKRIKSDIAKQFGYDSPEHRAVAAIFLELCKQVRYGKGFKPEFVERAGRIM
jgi:hypothetical protein